MNQRIAHILEIAHSDDDVGLHKQGSELSLLLHTLCLAQAPPAQVIEHIVKICSLSPATRLTCACNNSQMHLFLEVQHLPFNLVGSQFRGPDRKPGNWQVYDIVYVGRAAELWQMGCCGN